MPLTETAGILSHGNTTGYTWYNWPTKETRTDRVNVSVVQGAVFAFPQTFRTAPILCRARMTGTVAL